MEIIGVVLFFYLLVVVVIGYFAHRVTDSGREDYLMASRSFNTVVLFFAIFATNMTAVVLIGAPGSAYHLGPAILGYFVGPYVLLMPLFIITVGYRLWLAGVAFGHITPAQIIDDRLGTNHLGAFFMVVLAIWTVPYIQLGIQAGGVAIQAITSGGIPYWAGCLIVATVVAGYVTAGGMRGTAWTNVFQGILFVAFLLVVFVWVGRELGGFMAATKEVTNVAGDNILHRGSSPSFDSRHYISFGMMVTVAAFMFPQMLLRYMTAATTEALKRSAAMLVIAVTVTWAAAVLLGFWGRGVFPNLEGAESDYILPRMIVEVLPVWVAGLALAGILAAIMSSLDAQSLTIGTMLGEDAFRKYLKRVTEATVTGYARGITLVIIIVAYLLALLELDAVIGIAEFAFPGYALLFFPLVLALYWGQCSGAAVWSGVIVGTVVYLAFAFDIARADLAFGFHAWVPSCVLQLICMLIISKVTGPAPRERVEKYKNIYKGIW